MLKSFIKQSRSAAREAAHTQAALNEEELYREVRTANSRREEHTNSRRESKEQKSSANCRPRRTKRTMSRRKKLDR